ncbi:MAG: hypothetical protein QOI20_2924, partial [Acidimicrobiaceae bacterium]|nr:hypothetical protein [Acidimicrobiaceae bacterium]
MTRYCQSCGAEYIESVQDCADCGLPLQDAPALAVVAEQEDHEILVYELNTWEAEQRTRLEAVLGESGVPFQWEGTDLLVPAADEGKVDDLLDRIEFPDPLPAST